MDDWERLWVVEAPAPPHSSSRSPRRLISHAGHLLGSEPTGNHVLLLPVRAHPEIVVQVLHLDAPPPVGERGQCGRDVDGRLPNRRAVDDVADPNGAPQLWVREVAEGDMPQAQAELVPQR